MFIRVEFNADSQEDFSKLAEIMKLMGGSQDVKVETGVITAEPVKSSTKTTKEKVEKPVVAPTPAVVPVESTEETSETEYVEPEAEVAPVVTGQVVTLEMVRKIATELIQKNKTKEVNAVINKYAPKISELTDLQYATVYTQLKAL